MADRADAANPLRDLRHFEEHAAFTEFLEAAKFVHDEKSPLDLVVVAQMHHDFGVPFDPSHRFNDNFLDHKYPHAAFAVQAIRRRKMERG